MSEGYNGWKNYETWCVKLWADNGELCDPDEISEQGRYCAENFGEDAEEKMAGWLESIVDNHLRQWGSYAPTTGDTLHASGLGADLLQTALERVDWHEIAQAYCEEARENEAEQTANAEA